MKIKQIRFAEEYVKDLNTTQAALRAGYSEKTAYSIGHTLLKHVEVQKLIKDLQDARAERTQITADKVLTEFSHIGFSNIQNLIKDDNFILNLKRVKKEVAASVQSIRVQEVISPNGEKRVTTTIKLHDKVKALELIGRHLGIYEKDNEQAKTVVETVTNVIIENPYNDAGNGKDKAGS